MSQVHTHEDLTRKHEVRGSSNRAFGVVFSVFFLLVALSPLRRHGPVRSWALIVARAFLAVAIIRPAWLWLLNRLWAQLGRLLGTIVTPLVTAAPFYLVFHPLGILVQQP